MKILNTSMVNVGIFEFKANLCIANEKKLVPSTAGHSSVLKLIMK